MGLAAYGIAASRTRDSAPRCRCTAVARECTTIRSWILEAGNNAARSRGGPYKRSRGVPKGDLSTPMTGNRSTPDTAKGSIAPGVVPMLAVRSPLAAVDLLAPFLRDVGAGPGHVVVRDG